MEGGVANRRDALQLLRLTATALSRNVECRGSLSVKRWCSRIFIDLVKRRDSQLKREETFCQYSTLEMVVYIVCYCI